jgi:hypothetical protein
MIIAKMLATLKKILPWKAVMSDEEFGAMKIGIFAEFGLQTLQDHMANRRVISHHEALRLFNVDITALDSDELLAYVQLARMRTMRARTEANAFAVKDSFFENAEQEKEQLASEGEYLSTKLRRLQVHLDEAEQALAKEEMLLQRARAKAKARAEAYRIEVAAELDALRTELDENVVQRVQIERVRMWAR